MHPDRITSSTCPLLPDERWSPVAGWPTYEVSDIGRVGSLAYSRKTRKIRTLQTAKSGHKYITFSRPTPPRTKTFAVHRLVLEAFVGPCPAGMECCHNDGNPANNFVENLRWDTNQSNQLDKLKHGVSGRAKLTEQDIPVIWARLVAGDHAKDIIRDFAVTRPTISMIRSGKAWSHITRKLPPIPTSHGNATLIDDEVRMIWERLVAGEPGRAIAREFGVCEATVSLIRSGDVRSDITSKLPGWPLTRRGIGRPKGSKNLTILKYI